MSDQNPVFIPGPTNMPDRVRNAMNVQTFDHRSPKFAQLMGPLIEDLRKIYKTAQGEIIVFPSSGTGGWEAAVQNTLSPGDTVLAARHGMFSHRWIDLCQRHGLNVEIVETLWGEGAPTHAFAEKLAADKERKIKAVLVTHNETATGVRSDVAGVREALTTAGHDALLLVDCVSSLASMDFRFDEWGVDIAVSGSQKGFMVNTGMAIVAASPKAIDAMGSASFGRCFFDFGDMLAAYAKGGYPYTPTVQLLCGLREGLDMLFEEGLENVFDRHRRTAEGVRRAVAAWGLELCALRPELYSDTVSAVRVPEEFDSNALVAQAFDKYRMSFGVGLGPLNGKAFRIGHLGALTPSMVLSGLATIEMAMKDLGYPIALGSGVAAAQEYYRSAPPADAKEAA